jgi:hypothetical protein
VAVYCCGCVWILVASPREAFALHRSRKGLGGHALASRPVTLESGPKEQ